MMTRSVISVNAGRAHLQVGTETFELEGGPDDMSQDSVRLRGLIEEVAKVRSQSAINDLLFRPRPQPNPKLTQGAKCSE
jgi:hypothetical protein